jgi:hypothetical protein
MDRPFSVTLLPLCVRLYTCSPSDFEQTIHRHSFYRIHHDTLALTLLPDEITLYLYVKPEDSVNVENHQILRRITISDPRLYYVFDIHEDVPGIDHVGIIHNISHYFLQKQIPILYVNTYGHNLVFVSEDHYTEAKQILQDIGRLSV